VITSSSPKAGRLEVRPNASASPTATIASRSGWMWSWAAFWTLLDRDRLDQAAVAGQLVVRQIVDEEPADRPDDRAGRLEPQREDADQVVARGSQFGRVTAVSRIRRSSLIDSAMAGTVAAVWTAVRTENGPAPRRMSNPAPMPYV
jgi:hypothetical protein